VCPRCLIVSNKRPRYESVFISMSQWQNDYRRYEINRKRVELIHSWYHRQYLWCTVPVTLTNMTMVLVITRGLGWRSGQGAALLVGRSRGRVPVVSLDFSVTYLLSTVPWPWGRFSPYWKWVRGTFPGVKAAGAWGWWPHHLHVPNVMEIW
jgi:hypothetical protein